MKCLDTKVSGLDNDVLKDANKRVSGQGGGVNKRVNYILNR